MRPTDEELFAASNDEKHCERESARWPSPACANALEVAERVCGGRSVTSAAREECRRLNSSVSEIESRPGWQAKSVSAPGGKFRWVPDASRAHRFESCWGSTPPNGVDRLDSTGARSFPSTRADCRSQAGRSVLRLGDSVPLSVAASSLVVRQSARASMAAVHAMVLSPSLARRAPRCE